MSATKFHTQLLHHCVILGLKAQKLQTAAQCRGNRYYKRIAHFSTKCWMQETTWNTYVYRYIILKWILLYAGSGLFGFRCSRKPSRIPLPSDLQKMFINELLTPVRSIKCDRQIKGSSSFFENILRCIKTNDTKSVYAPHMWNQPHE